MAGAVIDWAWAGAGLDGGESGDLYVVVPLPSGALLAVIDGLGHGPEAALAARAAALVLQTQAELPVRDLIERCHDALHKTRGAVISLASLDTRSSTMDWCGVGNVEGLLFRATSSSGRVSEAVPTRGGVVGYRLPPLKVSTVAVSLGDLLVFASDGIRSNFSAAIDLDSPPQLVADAILEQYGKTSDDALVLVARYLGSTP